MAKIVACHSIPCFLSLRSNMMCFYATLVSILSHSRPRPADIFGRYRHARSHKQASARRGGIPFFL